MSHRRVASFLAVCVAVLGVGCPQGSGQPDFETFPSLTTSDADAETDLRAAREAAQAGRAAEAEQAYLAFLEEHPDDPLVPVAHLGLGRVLLADGRVEEALTRFETVAVTDDVAVAEAGRFYQGVALHLAGRHGEAIDLLQPLAGRTTDPARSVLLLRTLAAAARETGRTVLALEALDRLARDEAVPAGDRAEARDRIREIVAASDRQAVDAAYAELSRDGIAWPEVAVSAIRQAFDDGDMPRVAAIVAELRARDVPMSDELAELAVRAERTERADPRVIGAIAPLTGRARQIGQQVSHGLMLAAGIPIDGPPDANAPQLVLRDDGGDPARAAQAVEDLVSEHRAIAIIGPLEGQAARLAAQRAQDLGVPLITLVPDPEATSPGAMVFRLVPSPDEEAAVLVAAARARGASRFAILRPRHPFGRTMGDAFARAVVAAGAELVVDESYDAGATAFGEAITRLSAHPFDALFVPDSGRQLNLVAPALASADIWSTPAGRDAPRGGRAITLLAPSVAVDDRILRSERYFQGALFASGFHAPTARGAGRAFSDRYAERFGDAPTPFAAHAYDAFRLVRGAVEAGRQTRGDVARWLIEHGRSETAGASGGVNGERGPTVGARVLEVRGDAFVAHGASSDAS